MAKRRKVAEGPELDAMQVLVRLIALIAIKGVEKDEAAISLSSAGLGDKAVADLLGVSESTIRGMRFRSKKKNRGAGGGRKKVSKAS